MAVKPILCFPFRVKRLGLNVKSELWLCNEDFVSITNTLSAVISLSAAVGPLLRTNPEPTGTAAGKTDSGKRTGHCADPKRRRAGDVPVPHSSKGKISKPPFTQMKASLCDFDLCHFHISASASSDRDGPVMPKDFLGDM
jgi:hypothetical protein